MVIFHSYVSLPKGIIIIIIIIIVIFFWSDLTKRSLGFIPYKVTSFVLRSFLIRFYGIHLNVMVPKNIWNMVRPSILALFHSLDTFLVRKTCFICWKYLDRSWLLFIFPSEWPKKVYVSTLPWMNAAYFQLVSVKLNAPGGPRVVRSPSGAQRAGRLPVTWWMFFKAWRFSNTGEFTGYVYIYILYTHISIYFNCIQLYLCIWVHLILGVPMFFFRMCERWNTKTFLCSKGWTWDHVDRLTVRRPFGAQEHSLYESIWESVQRI